MRAYVVSILIFSTRLDSQNCERRSQLWNPILRLWRCRTVSRPVGDGGLVATRENRRQGQKHRFEADDSGQGRPGGDG